MRILRTVAAAIVVIHLFAACGSAAPPIPQVLPSESAVPSPIPLASRYELRLEVCESLSVTPFRSVFGQSLHEQATLSEADGLECGFQIAIKPRGSGVIAIRARIYGTGEAAKSEFDKLLSSVSVVAHASLDTNVESSRRVEQPDKCGVIVLDNGLLLEVMVTQHFGELTSSPEDLEPLVADLADDALAALAKGTTQG